MSDTHTRTDFVVPDGDILIHAGDATFSGNYAELWEFAKWYSNLPHQYKILISGNHDWGFQRQPEIFEPMMKEHGIIYLRDFQTEIEGFRIYGSPWQPEFGGWAWNLSRYEGELAHKWAMISDDTQILITHGPPKGILDRTAGYENVLPWGIDYEPPKHVGCWDLRERVKKLPKLLLHCFGHIHAAYGQEVVDGVRFVNASTCTEKYQATNPPIVVDL